MAGILKKLAGQTAIYGLSSIVGRMLNFLLVPLYTDVLLPEDYGIVSELYAYVAFLLVFLTFGMETTYFKFLNEAKDKVHTFNQSFTILFIVNIVVLFFGVFGLNFISGMMLYENYKEFVLLLLLIVILDALSSLPLAKLRAEEKPVKFAQVQLASIFTNIALTLVLLKVVYKPETDEPYWAILYILFANLAASLLKIILLRTTILNVSFVFDRELLKKMLYFALPIVVAGFAFIVNETIDRILLKQILNNPDLVPSTYTGTPLRYAESQVGIYSANYKLTMFIALFLQAFRYAAEPFFFANAKNDPQRKVYGKIMNLFVAVLCFAFLLVVLNLDFFKHFIRNEVYHIGLSVVPILLIANIFLAVYANQSIWYKLSGQTKFGAYISVGGAIITLSMLFILIPKYGYWAAAWTTFTVYGLQMVVSYVWSQRHYPIHYNLRKTGLYFFVAILFYGLSEWLSLEPGILKYLIHNILILVFIILVWLLEKNNVRNL